MASSIYASSVKSENTFGRVHSVLKNSGIENYIQTVSSEELLSSQIKSIISENISSKQEFYELTAYMFQSMTNIGYTTYEILEFICTSINAQGIFSDEEKKEIIEFYKDSFCFVHTDYSNYNLLYTDENKTILDKILFGHDAKKDFFKMGLVKGDRSAAFIGKSKGKFKKDLKVLSAFTGSRVPGASDTKQYEKLQKKFDNCSINVGVENPSKSNTSVSSILISNPNIRVGNQNSLELSSFFNGITTLEMNRSYPVLNAKFTIPALYRQSKNNSNYTFTATSSTINSFLFGDIDSSKRSSNYNSFAGNKIKDGVYESNMSMFTSPQTMVNFDEPIGHSQNNPDSLRRTTVHDPTQPLMTIQSFSINSAPTKGLMSYKSGSLNLVLHDRTRMNDIAPFVKPDLLGSFGAEITLEYGWYNPDGDNIKNPLGYFIGNSRVTEKYMIVNSSLSIDNNGQVNIALSIAMKGPYEFKNQQITTKVKNRVEEVELASASEDIDYLRSQIFSDSAASFLEGDGYKLGKSTRSAIFRETSRLTVEENKRLEAFKDEFIPVYNKYSINLSNLLDISTSDNKATFIFKRAGVSNDELKSFCKLITKESDAEIKKKVEASGNVEIVVNNSTKSKEELYDYVKRILRRVNDICNLIEIIALDDQLEEENEIKIIESIMGSFNYIDHFYPTSKKLLSFVGKNQNFYVSLGSVINTIVQHYIASSSQFDEIQPIFYTANEYAAGMANENIAKFLIDTKMLSGFLKNVFSKNTVITPESLISQIIVKFVQVGDNITLGLSELYEDRDRDYTKPLKIKNSSTANKNILSQAKKDRLRKIYGLNKDSTNKVPDHEIKFKMPIVHMNFDCLTANGISSKDPERSILRISIYDRANSPFSSSAEILQSIYQGNFNKTFGKFIENRRDFEKNHRKGAQKERRENLVRFNKKQKDELKRLADLKIITSNNDGTYSVNSSVYNQSGPKNYKASLKDVYKQSYPSLTFGTQNSVMISANVSTLNDNKLSTIFMTRPERNDQSLINNRINQNLPLVILPTQASVEIFGCPWVNFGQQIFLDFETGTTLDNRYVVTGITHDLTPGKFTTKLTLTYADNFGQAINFEDKLNEKTTEKNKKNRKTRKSRRGSGDSNETIKVIINPGYSAQGANEYFNDNLGTQV